MDTCRRARFPVELCRGVISAVDLTYDHREAKVCAVGLITLFGIANHGPQRCLFVIKSSIPMSGNVTTSAHNVRV
jgi:hypothetical protein